jgi:uncharacterized oxidoreductase
MLAIDPGHVGGAAHFAAEVDQLVDFMRSCPTVEGVKEITLPGDPERNTLSQRQRDGIPLDDGNWSQLTTLATRLKVPAPA